MKWILLILLQFSLIVQGQSVLSTTTIIEKGIDTVPVLVLFGIADSKQLYAPSEEGSGLWYTPGYYLLRWERRYVQYVHSTHPKRIFPVEMGAPEWDWIKVSDCLDMDRKFKTYSNEEPFAPLGLTPDPKDCLDRFKKPFPPYYYLFLVRQNCDTALAKRAFENPGYYFK